MTWQMHWRKTPHGWAYVPPQPQDPMRPLQEVLIEAIDGVIHRAKKQHAAPAA